MTISKKQLLLKNAEIRSLCVERNPDFLFNILNTIAGKSKMCDNEEIYQMVISLGELLKMNTLFKDQDFITLEQEMKYVKFYIYLQQMRFEDKYFLLYSNTRIFAYLQNSMLLYTTIGRKCNCSWFRTQKRKRKIRPYRL